VRPELYELDRFDVDAALDGADLVLVHEWNPPSLVQRIGDRRARANGFRLLFHDTHHRSVTRPDEMRRYDLSHYDGVLAFGERIRQRYLDEGWAARAWTWHEAADVRVFHPVHADRDCDVVWVGNWGDDERTAELHAFLIDPIAALGLRGRVYGVRYPEDARDALRGAACEYRGWLPNVRVPDALARARLTVHVPRQVYARELPGIPTIRMFEALACGVPLVSAPWSDVEGLFTPGEDYLVARSGAEMTAHMRMLVDDAEYAAGLAAHGLATILRRHTCAHRAGELLEIVAGLDLDNDRRPDGLRVPA
jgi:spore maturation protein CgeB